MALWLFLEEVIGEFWNIVELKCLDCFSFVEDEKIWYQCKGGEQLN